MHVMLDLETLGTRPGCVILSIGLVELPDGASTEISVDPVDAQRYGLSIDAGTVGWWLRQGEEARAAVTSGGRFPLTEALGLTADFLRESRFRDGGLLLWSKGPSFDAAILGAAYDAVGISRPWDHREERCVRTILAAASVTETFVEGVPHRAVDDARRQGKAVWEALERLRAAATF